MAQKLKSKSGRGGARKGAGRKPKATKTRTIKIALPEKPKNGRPFEYDASIFFAICERVAGGEFLAKICLEDGMPSEASFRRWKNSNDDLQAAYARAREDRADAWADELVQIADDGSRDYTQAEDGRLVPDHDHIQRSKLRVDARKWVMSKHAPRAYGEKVALEHSGKDGAPLTPVINVTIGGTEPTPAS